MRCRSLRQQCQIGISLSEKFVGDLHSGLCSDIGLQNMRTRRMMIKAIPLRKLSKVMRVERRPISLTITSGMPCTEKICLTPRTMALLVMLDLDPPRVTVSDHERVISIELVHVSTQSGPRLMRKFCWSWWFLFLGRRIFLTRTTVLVKAFQVTS